jgi:hypothetical protein
MFEFLEKVKSFMAVYKWFIIIVLVLFVICFAMFTQCGNEKDTQKAPTIIVLKPQKYDPITQNKINKIDSTSRAITKRINDLEGERLQRYIDSLFFQK